VNLRPVVAAAACVICIGALWGGAYFLVGRPTPEEQTLSESEQARSRDDKAMDRKLEDLRAGVLGKDDKTRGSDIHAPQTRPSKSAYDYTPREVCWQMKINYPDRYKDIDCADSKYDGTQGWIWTPGMTR
jgi:hypothetical protein